MLGRRPSSPSSSAPVANQRKGKQSKISKFMDVVPPAPLWPREAGTTCARCTSFTSVSCPFCHTVTGNMCCNYFLYLVKTLVAVALKNMHRNTDINTHGRSLECVCVLFLSRHFHSALCYPSVHAFPRKPHVVDRVACDLTLVHFLSEQLLT